MNQRASLRAAVLASSLFIFTGCALLFSDTYKSTDYHELQQATLNGDRAEMDRQLNHDPRSINALDYDKNTLLHLAVLRSHVDEIEDLLDRNADVEARDSAGMTPMHIAAKMGNAEVVKVLLTRSPNLTVRDSRGFTPLAWAIRAHRDPVVRLLNSAGAAE